MSERELAEKSAFKGDSVFDAEVKDFGLDTKYQLECIRAVLWKENYTLMRVCLKFQLSTQWIDS